MIGSLNTIANRRAVGLVLDDGTVLDASQLNDGEIFVRSGDQLVSSIFAGAFGTSFFNAQDLTSSFTTSTTFQTKVTLNLTGLPSGNYIIFWAADLRHTSSSRSIEGRVILDGNSIFGTRFEPNDILDQHVMSGHQIQALSGNHDLEIQWRRVGNQGTSFISQASLTVWRIN